MMQQQLQGGLNNNVDSDGTGNRNIRQNADFDAILCAAADEAANEQPTNGNVQNVNGLYHVEAFVNTANC